MSAVKENNQSGTYLTVNSINVLDDSQSSENVTAIQVQKVKSYFAERDLKSIKELLSDMASDSVISALEKVDLQAKMNEIALDHSILLQDAEAYGLDSSQIYADYNTAYNTLLAYINPILATPSVSSPIDPTIYQSNWDSYWNTRETLESAISTSYDDSLVKKEEVQDGYDLEIDGEVVATTTPDIPTVLGSSTKRDIYLSWNRQPKLTGTNVVFEIQVSEIAFASDDLALGYSLGPGGDDPEDWQGVAGSVTMVYGYNHSIKNYPLTQGESGAGAKTYFFRVRCRQSDSKVSDWGEISVAVSPINAADIAKDTVSQQISNFNALTTMSEQGFMGANYNLTDDVHVFTTVDQRIFIDSDEVTLQKVIDVSPENVPTWSDVLKVGGSARALVMKEMAQRIGYDLDGANESSIAFAKALSDFSDKPTPMVDYPSLALQASGNIAFVDTDSNAVMGYINTNNRQFYWKGDIALEGVFTGGGVGPSRVLHYSFQQSEITYISDPITIPAHAIIKIDWGFSTTDENGVNKDGFYRINGGDWIEVADLYLYVASHVSITNHTVYHSYNGVGSRIAILDFSNQDADFEIEIKFDNTYSVGTMRKMYVLVENMISARGEKGEPGTDGEKGEKGDPGVDGEYAHFRVEGGRADTIYTNDQTFDGGDANG